MKGLWVAALLVLLCGCTGADRRDPEAVAKATQALEAGQVEVARMHAENAFKYTPDDPGSRRVLAAVHRELGERASSRGEFGRAADAYVRAAEHEPKRVERAQDYRSAYDASRDAGRDRTSSVELLVGSIDAEPTNLEVRMEAASAFDELGRPEDAIVHYLYIWEADRSAVPVGMRLGLLYVVVGEDGDAEAVFRRVIDHDPDNVQAQLQLAELYERAGRGSRSRRVYEDLAERYPDNPAILFRYADFLERAGNPEEAEEMRDDARNMLPGVERRDMRRLRSRRKR